jgi:peptidoglycan-N-acetylglucosamine deacetylase
VTRRVYSRTLFRMTTVFTAAVAVGACTHAVPEARARRADAAPAADSTTTSALAPQTTVPNGVVFHGSRARPLVALTFDTNMTDLMEAELDHHRVASFANIDALDELDRMDVPATIFLAGKWIERYPDVTRRLAADPLFELASHSYAHRAFHAPCYGLGRAMPAAEMAADVEHSEALLRSFTAAPTPYFRFPGGCYDDAALAAVAPTGVTVVQYDVVSGDAFGRSASVIVGNVVRNTANGSIVVMHLTGGNTAPLTAAALPPIVTGLRARGFTLVKLSVLLAP